MITRTVRLLYIILQNLIYRMTLRIRTGTAVLLGLGGIKMNTENVKWLLSCPCNDGNFKIHLKSASESELKSALMKLPVFHNKTKIKVIKAELNRRNKK